MYPRKKTRPCVCVCVCGSCMKRESRNLRCHDIIRVSATLQHCMASWTLQKSWTIKHSSNMSPNTPKNILYRFQALQIIFFRCVNKCMIVHCKMCLQIVCVCVCFVFQCVHVCIAVPLLTCAGWVSIWVWLKIKQQGQTAGSGFHVSTCQGKPFWNSGCLSHSHLICLRCV